MKFSNFIKNFFMGIYSSVKRFPLTIITSVCIAAILITVNELEPETDMLQRVAMVFGLGIPLSLAIKLFFERRNEARGIKHYVSYVAGAGILIIYYIFLLKELNMVSITRYVGLSCALYLIFLFVPHFYRRKNFEMHVIAILTIFFTTVLYSAVLYAGLSAILFSIDQLLGIQVVDKIYYYTFLFVVFIFAVSYFMGGIPESDKEPDTANYPKLLRILVLYIIMPLLTAYTTILYIYFGKILLTGVWPQGLVSHLVLWYALIVTAVLLLITAIKQNTNWSEKFYMVAPKVVIPLLVMMFISIGIRINAYGITEKRYYVVIAGVWILGVMIYFSFIKGVKTILVPITLSLIILISVFGPVSSYSLSKMSQNNRFEELLVQNNMIQNGTIVPVTDVSEEDRVSISSIVQYFENSHTISELKYMPQDFTLQDMKKTFGFEYQYPKYNVSGGYFNYQRENREGLLDIRGYDYLFDMNYIMMNEKRGNENAERDFKVDYNYENSTISIKYKGEEVYYKDLSGFIDQTIKENGTFENQIILSDEKMTYIDENDKVKVKIVFFYISGRTDTVSGGVQERGTEFYLLLDMK